MWIAALLACSGPRGPDVVLVSLDTTRADALGPAWTPKLEGLAATSVRFTSALAHAPTTLSSHASVFTGRDPHRHGVPRNGFPLGTGPATLAERLHAAGYDTIGVVGASVLGRDTGIARGFDTWTEAFTVDRGNRQETDARTVTNAAIEVLAERGRDPLLLFVHYFDAHAPYDAPGDWKRRFADPAYAGPFDGSKQALTILANQARAGLAEPADLAEVEARYHGEVGYVDEHLGRLLAAVPRDAVVVVFGDHGEHFGNSRHQPFGHGLHVDEDAIRVPLIVRVPGTPAGERGRARLMDVGSTVLARLGLGALGDGIDLLAGAPGPSFAEATQPTNHARRDAWPNLDFERSVADGDSLLIRAPLRGEEKLVGLGGAAATAQVGRLRELLQAWDAAAPGAVRDGRDEETMEKLKALGYGE